MRESQGHRTIDRPEERGIEKGSRSTILLYALKGRDGVIVKQIMEIVSKRKI